MSWRIPSLRIPASDPATRQALLLGLVALIYFLSGKLGLSFAEVAQATSFLITYGVPWPIPKSGAGCRWRSILRRHAPSSGLCVWP